MRILAWNIRAGGGRRWEAIATQIARWKPDVAVLSEFRGTAPSQHIAVSLCSEGLVHQRSTADVSQPRRNALLVASRWPLRRLAPRPGPEDPHRWLPVHVAAPRRFAVLATHVPNRVSGTKIEFLEALTRVARRWRGAPAMLIGDTNSGRIGQDEESRAFDHVEDGWIQGLHGLGWHDAFRIAHGRRREFTWYSPNGNNGFRLDQGFLQRPLIEDLERVRHRWGSDGSRRRDVLSDHAALLLDLGPR